MFDRMMYFEDTRGVIQKVGYGDNYEGSNR